MSNSVRPQRWQPTRLLCPWGSPGKNSGVGCHFLLQCLKVKSESEVAQLCLTLSDPMDYSPSSPLFMGFLGQEYWSGLPFLPPGDLPDSGIEPVSLTSPALAGGCFCFVFLPLVPPGKPVFPTDYTFFYPSVSDSLSFKVTFSQSEMLIWSLIKQML